MKKTDDDVIDLLYQYGADDIEPKKIWDIHLESREVTRKLADLINFYQDPGALRMAGLPDDDVGGELYAEITGDQSTISLEIGNPTESYKLLSKLKHQISELIKEDHQIRKTLEREARI